MDANQTTTFQAPGLSRKIGLAWATLAWESLWPRLVPTLAIALLLSAVIVGARATGRRSRQAEQSSRGAL